MRSSLQKEKEILKSLVDCTNFVGCFGGFTSVEPDQTMRYNLFLEYASGGTLLDLMNIKGGKIPECDAKGYTRMIVEGVTDIHERGYVRSDLKPANILVFPSHGNGITLKIADFGLAKHWGEKDEISGLCFRGAEEYMSPESIKGEMSGALDVWSVGCILMEMISGKIPWKYSNLKDLTKKLLKGETPEFPENMLTDGKDLLAMCFARDPNQRWTANMLLSHPFLFQVKC
ncbi:putative FAD-binding Berberine family protein [Hibiscus syriacus]|uniref:FAD-binding Berberine family protein n=1 Tax=Hibiscus syriacus TaxID=106335 RepID=A0A6A2XM11_HIBSY|nr:mitogen-activated protein kinase kinase kinase 17-like [Hibiscus syriacus]KAE8654944.1 putative FAD-binding Berberine family protein [Hibiscus syriacus]